MSSVIGVALREKWADVDVDTADLWSGSGARWISDRRLGTPAKLVKRLAGAVEFLDDRGAGLAGTAGPYGLGLLSERAASMGLPPSDRISCGGASRFVRCADGWLAVSLARDSDVELIPAWLEINPFDPADAWAVVEGALGDRHASEIVERASILGVPCSSVGENRSADAVRVATVASASPRQLKGLVVMNLSSLWAGPLCADILGRLGARVITIESTRRPDGGRAASRFFGSLHENSESVALDLRAPSEQAKLNRLLRCADVVIEGSRPRALEQMGIDARSVVSDGPVVWLSITSHGRERSLSSRVGFGDDAAAAGGLVGWVNDVPRFVADAVADPLTGVTAAAAIVQLLEAGERWLVDIALARVARSMAGQWIAAASAKPSYPRRRPGPLMQMPLGRDTTSVLREFGVAGA